MRLPFGMAEDADDDDDLAQVAGMPRARVKARTLCLVPSSAPLFANAFPFFLPQKSILW